MTIRDIVLHQGADSRALARLEIAIALAKSHNARLIGIFAMARTDVPHFWLPPLGEKWVEELRDMLRTSAADCENAFRTRVAAEGLACDWRVITGLPSEVMATSARFGDLTVIGQTDPEEWIYGGAIPDAVVLSAGGPVLLVPYAGDFDALGRRVMVAWNGTREAARAVRDSLPFLKWAESVIVFIVGPADPRYLGGADLCAYLARHGVEAELRHAVSGVESDAVDASLATVGGFGFQEHGAWTRSRHTEIGEAAVGDALLNGVADNGIDLLVMGAYGHSRAREVVFGGVTRQMLDTMTVPVLMSN